ncbi:MAG: DUF4360 domain-containing protein [Polyangiales bacterium]
MSRCTRVARRAPLLPFRPFDPSHLVAALMLAPLIMSGCTSPDGETGASKSGPIAPEDDPIVRVVPLDDVRSDASAPDASRTPATPRDGGVDASVRDEPPDASPATTTMEEPAATPSTPTLVERDASTPRGDATTAGATCAPEAPAGAGTTLRSAPATVTTAAGPVEVAVRASGTGCPPCTSRTTLAPDGETFTIVFSAFDVALSGAESASRQCDVAISLRSATGHAYAVTDFSYQGFADLESGQTARQTTGHRFTAASARAEPETQLTGPREGAYEYRAPIADAEPTWSACGTERELIIGASASVSDAQRRAGSVSLSATGAQASAKIELKLDARECEP